MNFGKNPQHDFPKIRGGWGQRPFGTFPKIHPFLKGQASLRCTSKVQHRIMVSMKKGVNLFMAHIKRYELNVEKGVNLFMAQIIKRYELNGMGASKSWGAQYAVQPNLWGGKGDLQKHSFQYQNYL